jgi:hypothetical protein
LALSAIRITAPQSRDAQREDYRDQVEILRLVPPCDSTQKG